MKKGLAFFVATTVASGAYTQENRCIDKVDFSSEDPCQIPECSDEMQECQMQVQPKEEPQTLCAAYNDLICNIS